jgi:hypothetical protein
MSEIKARVQRVTNKVEKAIGEQASRIEVAVVNKLQTAGLNKAGVFMENAFRIANEQLAFVERKTGEWRKLVLAATHSAAEAFAPKTEIVASKTEIVASKTEIVASRSEIFAPKTEIVASKAETLASKPEIAAKPEIVDSKKE